MMIKKNI